MLSAISSTFFDLIQGISAKGTTMAVIMIEGSSANPMSNGKPGHGMACAGSAPGFGQRIIL